SEYMAKYNLGFDVPFTPYVTRAWGNISTISAGSRGIIRPVWELLYAHYDGVTPDPVAITSNSTVYQGHQSTFISTYRLLALRG
ncbi:hypothetical protein QCA50_011230, partial [Cerrena zonata]